MAPLDIWNTFCVLRQEFAEFLFAKFPQRLRAMRKRLLENGGRSEQEYAAFLHDILGIWSEVAALLVLASIDCPPMENCEKVELGDVGARQNKDENALLHYTHYTGVLRVQLTSSRVEYKYTNTI